MRRWSFPRKGGPLRRRNDMEAARPISAAPAAGLALAIALLACWPMVVSGTFFVFPDTSSYLRAGQLAWSMVGDLTAGPTDAGSGSGSGEAVARAAGGGQTVLPKGHDNNGPTARSLTYPVMIYAFWATTGVWAMAVAQTWMVAFVALALVPKTILSTNAFAASAVMLALLVLTPLPFYGSYLTPDILSAVPILFAALVATRIDALTGWHLVAVTAVSAVAVTTHYGNIPLVIGCVLVALALRTFVLRKIEKATLFASAIVVLTAPLANLGISSAVLHKPSVVPVRLPILLARSIEDGPAQWYLTEVCPKADLALCELLGEEIPDNVGTFLWSSQGIASATPRQMDRIRAEEWEVLGRAFLRYPLQQTYSLARNALRQGMILTIKPLKPVTGFTEDFVVIRPDDRRAHRMIATFDPIVKWSTLGLSLILLPMALPALRTRENLCLVAVVVAGLAINALVFGGLSAPSNRYQSRVFWILPLALAIPALAHRPVRRALRKVRS